MNGWRGYSVRLEGAKYGVSFGSALAMAISYNTNQSILWAIIHGPSVGSTSSTSPYSIGDLRRNEVAQRPGSSWEEILE